MCTGSCSTKQANRPQNRLGFILWVFFALFVPCVRGTVVEAELSRFTAADLLFEPSLAAVAAEENVICAAISSSNIPAGVVGDVCSHAGCVWHADEAACETSDDHDHDHDHDHEHEHGEGVVPHAIGAGVVMLVVAGLGAGLPFCLQSRKPTAIFLANAFGCGALLAFSLVHLLPEATVLMAEENMDIHVGESSLPLAYILCLVGFVLASFLESLPTPAPRFDDDCSSVADMESSLTTPVMHAGTAAADFCTTLGLCVHSFFEGLVVGSAASVAGVWISTLSIVFHKWAAGMGLAQALLERGHRRKFTAVTLALFVIASPVGVFAGSLVSTGGSRVIGPINGLCAGLVLHLGVHLLDTFSTPKNTKLFAIGWITCAAASAIIVGLMVAHLSQHHH